MQSWHIKYSGSYYNIKKELKWNLAPAKSAKALYFYILGNIAL